MLKYQEDIKCLLSFFTHYHNITLFLPQGCDVCPQVANFCKLITANTYFRQLFG